MIQNAKKALLILLTLALLAAIPPANAASLYDIATKGYVIENTMDVYQYPSILSKLLGTMSFGEDVRVLSWQDGWIRVQNHKGKIGYCPYGSLSRKDPCTLDMFGYVKEAGVHVYAKPGAGYKIIDSLEMGDRLRVVGMTKDKEWLRVYSGKRFGYVQKELMSKTPTIFDWSV